MGCRSYVDAQMTDAIKISRSAASISDSESDDEADATVRMAADSEWRRGLRKFPGAEVLSATTPMAQRFGRKPRTGSHRFGRHAGGEFRHGWFAARKCHGFIPNGRIAPYGY